MNSSRKSSRGVTMRAATRATYGAKKVIKVGSVERPTCGPDEVLVAVRAASVNPFDWHKLTGFPLIMRMGDGLLRPKDPRLGIDCAGVIAEVGQDVKQWTVGDEVFGCADGSFAEYAVAKASSLAAKPQEISFDKAASAGVAPLTALQGLRDHGQLESGQHVLVNGASGGVGTYAVQLAKHFGAEVTGVCSARNFELIQKLGSDHVIDYTTDDFTSRRNSYDVVLDLVGNHSIRRLKRCLSPHGTYVVASGPKGKIFGPLFHMLASTLAFKFGTRNAAVFIAQQTSSDFQLIGQLLESKAIRSIVTSTFSLDDIGVAFDCIESGHTSGKIVVRPQLDDESPAND